MNEPTGRTEKLPVGGEAPAKKSGGSLKWIIIGVAIAAVGGVAAWKLIPSKTAAAHGEEGIVEVHEPAKPPDKPPPFGEVLTLDDIVINPAGSRRVFMVTVALELGEKAVEAEVEKRQSLLRDNLITLFASQPLDVLIDIKYRQAFRTRVKKIMDYQLGEGTVTRVFFEKWVFQ